MRHGSVPRPSPAPAMMSCFTISFAWLGDVWHPQWKQQTTPAAPRDALHCVAALALTREGRQNCVRFSFRGPHVDRLHVLELDRNVE